MWRAPPGSSQLSARRVTEIASHEVACRVPTDDTSLHDPADVVVISDVGANTAQLAPETFAGSIPSPAKAEVVRHSWRRAGESSWSVAT